MRLGHILLGDVGRAAELLDLALSLATARSSSSFADLLEAPIDLAGAARPALTESETFSGLVVVGS
jgi:hypothetical protein